MKKAFNKIWNYIEGINGLLLSIYTSAVLSAYVILMNDSKLEILRFVYISVLLSVILCPLLIKSIRRMDFNKTQLLKKGIKAKNITFFFFVVPFLSLFIHYIIYYPGGFSPDSIKQYEQAITNNYSDWHPVTHTLLAFKLPLLLTGGWVGSIVLFQIILLSLAIGYTLLTVRKYTNNTVLLILMLFFAFNPQLLNISMYPWKDVAFAIGTLFLVSFALNIYFTEGEWVKKNVNIVFLILIITLTTLVRHNAILFTVPYIIGISLIIGKKRALLVILSVIVLFVGVKYPLYNALNVSEPGSRQVETLGLPMSVIGEVVSTAPDSLDNETKEFAYKIAPAKQWDKSYNHGYNSIKFFNSNNDVVEEYGAKKVLLIMTKCIKADPVISLKGFIKVTCPVYSLSGDYIFNEFPVVGENDYGIQSRDIHVLHMINARYSQLCSIVLPHLFFYLGAVHLLILIIVFAKLKLNRLVDWKKLLIIAPMFAYNFGTMLLLSGSEDANRFFFYSFLIAPLYLIILLKNHNWCEKGGIAEKCKK